VITTWSPDTCECIIEYEADGNLTRVIKACDAHKGDTEQTIFQNLKEENPRKNNALKEILDNAPPGLFDVDAESGSRVFKQGINLDFAWSGVKPNRILTLTVKGITLTANQLNAVQTKLNNKFGPGKVTLVQG
jgi:hypothetical protein